MDAPPATSSVTPALPPRVIVESAPVRGGRFRHLPWWIAGVSFVVASTSVAAAARYFQPAGQVAERWHSLSKEAPSKVAIVDVVGAIMGGNGFARQQFDRVADDPSVKAIVLRVDSPGGTVAGSDELHHRLAELVRKRDLPVVVSMGSIAASGGYYVAVAAERIVAAPGTLTGSIGVVGGKVAIGGGLEKLGIHTDVVSKGRNAGWLSLTEPFTDAGRAAFMGTMQDVYRLFTTKVAAGRKLDLEQVQALAEGRVFTGRMAKEAGLVDRLGTLDDAVAEAKQLAGLPADEAVERLLLPEPRGLFEDLFGMVGGGDSVARALAAAGSPLRAAIVARIAAFPGLGGEIDAFELLASGRPLLMLPARIRVK